MEAGEGAGVQSPGGAGGGRERKWGKVGGEKKQQEGFWGAVGLPYSISLHGLGRAAGCIFGLPSPHLAPGGSLAGSGVEQAGGIFILEQHCRGGLVQELSVTAAAGEDPCWLPKLTLGQGARPGGGHGSPGAWQPPCRDWFPPRGVLVPLFEPCKGRGVAPITLCRKGGSYHCMGMGKLRHGAKRCSSSPAWAVLNQCGAQKLHHLHLWGLLLSFGHLQPEQGIGRGLGWVVVSVIMGYTNTNQPRRSQRSVRPISVSCAKPFLPNPYEIRGELTLGLTSPSLGDGCMATASST